MREAYVWRVVNGRARSVAASELLAWATTHASGDAFAVDTETAGIEWADAVRLVQFGNADVAYGVRADTMKGRRLIADVLTCSPARLVFHNAPFDLHALHRIGIDVRALWSRVVDTYVLCHVFDPAAMHGLKPQSVMWLGADSADEQKGLKSAMRRHGWTWGTVPLLVLLPYAMKDPQLTWRLYDFYKHRLTYTQWAVAEREMEVAACVWKVEQHGMRLDVAYASELEFRWTQQLQDLKVQLAGFLIGPGVLVQPRKRKLSDIAAELAPKYAWPTKAALMDAAREVRNSEALHGPPEPEYLTNPNANAQVAGALIQQGWQPQSDTPTGKPVVDKKTLEALAGQYTLVDLLLEHRRITKWRTAYVEACLLTMDSVGRVHASYNTLGAVTGRMSCSRPPLQQLPKGGGGEVRQLFIASEGNVIASVDYSAVEFRLAGALSGEPRIIDVYAAGGDWYQQVANDLKISRPQAKVFCLAIMYGARGKRIKLALGLASVTTGNRLVREFWKRYPVLKAWLEALEADATQGLEPVSYWGRPLKPHAPYAAGNAVIQGTAAEVMKDGLLRVAEAGLLGYVVAIVHDEVVLDLPAERAEALTSEVARALSDLDTFACPLVAEGKIYGRSWGDGYAAAT